MANIKSGQFKKIEQRDKKIVTFDQLDVAIHRENTKVEIAPLAEPPNWRMTDSILVKAPGYWWIHSKIDARWRAEGKSEEVGGEGWCPEAKRKFLEMKSKYGQHPWDTVYRFELRDLKKFKLASEMKKK